MSINDPSLVEILRQVPKQVWNDAQPVEGDAPEIADQRDLAQGELRIAVAVGQSALAGVAVAAAGKIMESNVLVAAGIMTAIVLTAVAGLFYVAGASRVLIINRSTGVDPYPDPES